MATFYRVTIAVEECESAPDTGVQVLGTPGYWPDDRQFATLGDALTFGQAARQRVDGMRTPHGARLAPEAGQ